MASSLFAGVAALLARSEPFTLLTDAEREAILNRMTVELYSPGEIILQQGEDVHRALYVVEDGLVRLAEAGTGRTVDIVGAGSALSAYGLLQGGALPFEARAVERTSCALIAAETFHSLVKRNEAFKAYFADEIKRYVRSLDEDIDASGAYLLFDTPLSRLLHAPPPTVDAHAPIREAARAMADAAADAVVVVQDGAPVGVVTEGDIAKRVVAQGRATDAPVLSLVERPPIALRADERLFAAVRTMMAYRIRRIVVLSPADGSLLGLLTAEDLSHYRGLDPVATTERLERAQSVAELGALRTDANRRLYRLSTQGVHSENLLGVVTELDDQLKQRLLTLVEEELREETRARGAEPPDTPWAWLAFGSAGRRESDLRARQNNAVVYADGAGADAAAFFATLGRRAAEALESCGFDSPEHALSAADPAFCLPLDGWHAAYATWIRAEDADATARAGLAFDLRALHGDESLADALRDGIAARLPNPRLSAVFARECIRTALPLSTFGRFEVDEVDGVPGIDIRERALLPIISLARALALETGYLASANTFDRLRHVAAGAHPLAEHARALLPAYTTLVDLHLRSQMQAAENGERPTHRVDPDTLHKSQQNLVKEALQVIRKAQDAARKHFKL
jgi:CBS domain-containing protein